MLNYIIHNKRIRIKETIRYRWKRVNKNKIVGGGERREWGGVECIR